MTELLSESIKKHFNEIKKLSQKNKRIGVIISAPPRMGGTTAAIKLAEELNDGIVLYTNIVHTAVEHAMLIWDALTQDNSSGQLVGKGYAQRVIETVTRIVNEGDVEQIIHTPLFSAKHITFSSNIDNSEILREACREACSDKRIRFIGCPSAMIPYLEPIIEKYKIGYIGTLLIDEDTTLQSFMPKSSTIVSMKKVYGRWNIELSIDNKVLKELEVVSPALYNWLMGLVNKIKEYLEDRPSPRKSVKKWYIDNDENPDIAFFRDLADCYPPPPKVNPRHILAPRGGKTSKAYFDAVALAISIAYFRKLHFKVYKSKAYLSIVSDEESGIIHKQAFSRFNTVIIRSNDRIKAENFLRAIGIDTIYTIEEDEFIHARNFWIFAMSVKPAIKYLYNHGVPCLIITRSKYEAESAKDWCNRNGIDAYVVSPQVDTISLQKSTLYSGRVLIIYERSVLSRGIDLPSFYTIVVWSTDYYCPYEEYMSEIDEEYRIIKKYRFMVELEQNILRASPVKMKDAYPTLTKYYNSIPRFVIIPVVLYREIKAGLRKFNFLVNRMYHVKRENIWNVCQFITTFAFKIETTYPMDGQFLLVNSFGQERAIPHPEREKIIDLEIYTDRKNRDEYVFAITDFMYRLYKRLGNCVNFEVDDNLEYFIKKKAKKKYNKEFMDLLELVNATDELPVTKKPIKFLTVNITLYTGKARVLRETHGEGAVVFKMVPYYVEFEEFGLLDYMCSKIAQRVREDVKYVFGNPKVRIRYYSGATLLERKITGLNKMMSIWRGWLIAQDVDQMSRFIEGLCEGDLKASAAIGMLRAIGDAMEKGMTWKNYSEFRDYIRYERDLHLRDMYINILFRALINSHLVKKENGVYKILSFSDILEIITELLQTRVMLCDVRRALRKYWEKNTIIVESHYG